MKQELIFIPLPAAGHLTSSLQMAKLLVSRDENLSVRILVFRDNNPANNAHPFKSLYSEAAGSSGKIHFSELQQPQNMMNPQKSTDPFIFLCKLMECCKPQVHDLVSDLVNNKNETRLVAGFVVDMFTTAMMDVADQFGIPSYLFYTSGAATLGLWLHLRNLIGEERCSIDFQGEFDISTYENTVPAKLFPSPMFTEEGLETCIKISSRIFEVKGIFINTFLELESGALKALAGVHRTVYTVGPLINFEAGDQTNQPETETIMKWLDDQPDSSVVFLCFGSLGFFEASQAKEIANALESSKCRFLWSLKTTHPSNPNLHLKLQDLLPDGFLERTSDVGKVIGWAPQVAVLGHAAVGGFVTHCGWNSVLESVWFGVPMAAWPMYAEQQMNAFQVVKEVGIAVEIKMDYNVVSKVNVVSADEIEKAVRKLMQDGGGERKKVVKELMEKARSAMSDGGSSSTSMARLTEDLLALR